MLSRAIPGANQQLQGRDSNTC